MRVSIILVSSAALVAAAPVPGVGETIWKGITYIPRKVGACVGACVKGVDEAVTVQIPGAVHGLGDGISAGTRVGKHEAEESMEAFVKGKHAEKDAITAANAQEKATDKVIYDTRMQQLTAEHAARKAADDAAYAAIQKAIAERDAAFAVVQKAHDRNDQVAYEAALAAYYAKENAVEQARATFQLSQQRFKDAEEARIKAIIGSSSSSDKSAKSAHA